MIFISNVWLARSLSDDNPSQSIKHLNIALRLSKSVKKLIEKLLGYFPKIKN